MRQDGPLAHVYIQHYRTMEFIWDPSKDQATRDHRKFGFALAARIFGSETFERPYVREEYGEPRVIAIGAVDGTVLTVVYTDRTTSAGTIIRRIISARRSNRRERQAYQGRVGAKDPDAGA